MDIEPSGIEDKESVPPETTVTKTMIRHALAYAPSSFVPAIISFLAIIIYTRKFSPTQYGIYILFISTITIINLFVSTWIQFVILRYRAEYIKDSNIESFNTDLIFLLSVVSLFLLLAGSIGILIFYLVTHSLDSIILFGAGYLLIDIWYSNLCFVLMADLKSKNYTFFIVLNSCLSFLIAIAFIFMVRPEIAFIVLGMFLSELILLAPLVYSTRLMKVRRKLFHELKTRFKADYWPFLRKAFSYGFPMIGWLISIQLLNIVDRYILEAFKGSVEVGIYSPNYALSIGILGLVATPISFAAYSLIMKESSVRGKMSETTRDLIKKFSRYYLLVTIPVYVFLALYSKDLVRLFLGEDYWAGYVVIPIVSFGYLAWNFGMYGHKGLELAERTKTMLFYVGICILTNIGLNLILVPLMGYKGAAITTMISLSLYPVLVFIGTRHFFPWKIPWRSLFNVLVAALCMSVVLILFHLFSPLQSNAINLLIGFGLGLITYLVMIYFLKEITQAEITLLKAGMRKAKLMR